MLIFCLQQPSYVWSEEFQTEIFSKHVWYDRNFFVPRSWEKDQRVWLRFGSVHYEAFVVSSQWKDDEMNILSCIPSPL